jgi:hypothetical protein
MALTRTRERFYNKLDDEATNQIRDKSTGKEPVACFFKVSDFYYFNI